MLTFLLLELVVVGGVVLNAAALSQLHFQLLHFVGLVVDSGLEHLDVGSLLVFNLVGLV